MNGAEAPAVPKWREFLRSPALSPQGFVVRAAVLAAVFAVLHVAGLREYTSFISGTPVAGRPITWWTLLPGTAYMAAYFAFVVLVPVQLLAAALWWGAARLARRAAPGGTESGP